MYLVTAGQMQSMDKETIESFGIPGLVLMENAGRGAFEMFVRKFKGLSSKKVAVLAGPGNNGGDGFVVARYLMGKNIQTRVFLLSSKERVKGDAEKNMILVRKLCERSDNSSIVEIPDAEAFSRQRNNIAGHDIFIDAILGTGLNSDVRGFFKDAVELMNRSDKPVFSLDISSGINSDTGIPMGTAVRASATASFAFAKAGHILYPGNLFTGDLETVDIGIPGFIAEKRNIRFSLIEKDHIASFFEPRDFQSHKGSFGHLLVIAGSVGKTGAAALCSNAAMRCGTGLVTLGIARSLNRSLEPQVTETMTWPLPEREEGYLSESCFDEIMDLSRDRQAMAVGPGLGTGKGTKKLVEKIVRNSLIPLVIDADGLNCIADSPGVLKEKKAMAVLTPHPGEMARLCRISAGDVQKNRIKTASGFAKEFDTVLVLKGAQTVIGFPDGKVFISNTGNSGMASGGMGDVLTGMISGFVAQGFSPENASLAGVYFHGACGDLLAEKTGPFGFLASDMVDVIPETIHKNLLK